MDEVTTKPCGRAEKNHSLKKLVSRRKTVRLSAGLVDIQNRIISETGQRQNDFFFSSPIHQDSLSRPSGRLPSLKLFMKAEILQILIQLILAPESNQG